ncbi:MAG TPA: FliH/SctL family protein [Pirellulales bacterium]|nr:FliH/SctL family protein [Pirellulales bacterium]
MSTIIKAPAERIDAAHAETADARAKAETYLDSVRHTAQTILADAYREADEIRRAAAFEGREEAKQIAEQQLAQQIATIMPALRQAVDGIEQTRGEWLTHQQRQLVNLACKIAERIIRRELSSQPQITLDLVRESLERVTGRADVRVLLSPADFASLHHHVEEIADELSRLGSAEVVADTRVTPGGCIVETRYGMIDQRIESQLARIAEELI